jgi:hypothetical protein
MVTLKVGKIYYYTAYNDMRLKLQYLVVRLTILHVVHSLILHITIEPRYYYILLHLRTEEATTASKFNIHLKFWFALIFL